MADLTERPAIQVVSTPYTVTINITDKNTAIGLVNVVAEAALKKVDGVTTWDIGWQELAEQLLEATGTVWPDCTCDVPCKVHDG